LVVLATQDRLGYGQNFEEAMKSLFGESAQPPAIAQAKPGQPVQESPGAATPPATQAPTPQQDTEQLVNQALQDLDDYQRLTAQGKLGEAGQKLESARRTLEEAKRRQKSP
jgi:uncharacterized membrane protein (UPF0182 family)